MIFWDFSLPKRLVFYLKLLAAHLICIGCIVWVKVEILTQLTGTLSGAYILGSILAGLTGIGIGVTLGRLRGKDEVLDDDDD